MSRGLTCACPCPLPTNQASSHNRRLETAFFQRGTERLNGPSRSLLVFNRPHRELVARCSTETVERLDAMSAGNVGQSRVEEEGSSEEDLRQVKLEDLRIGGCYKGKVSVVESYGVFVDIGARVDGFVHVSRLGEAIVSRVEDVMQVGQSVTVKIVDLDPCAESISVLLAPEEDPSKTFKMQPLALSEREIFNRATARRAKKLAARCAGRPFTRRVMSFETRQQLKAHRRVVLAEWQAIQLHQARSRTSFCKTPEGVPATTDGPG